MLVWVCVSRNSLVGRPLDLRSFSFLSSPSSSSSSSLGSFFFNSQPSNRPARLLKTRLATHYSPSFSSLSLWRHRFRLHARDSWNRLSASFSRLSMILPHQHTPFTLSFSTLFFFRASVDLFFYLCQISWPSQGDEAY